MMSAACFTPVPQERLRKMKLLDVMLGRWDLSFCARAGKVACQTERERALADWLTQCTVYDAVYIDISCRVADSAK